MSEILVQDVPHAADVPRPDNRLFRRALRQRRTQVGLLIVGVVVIIAIAGQALAPHDAGELVSAPYSRPGPGSLLGTDYLGEDVWSRLLEGGRTVVIMSLLSTLLGVALGTVVGLIAGTTSSSFVDNSLMRVMDVVLAFPPIVFVLLAVSMVGPQEWLIIVTIGIAWMPQVSRTIRGAASEIVARDYVQAVTAIGAPKRHILAREVLPNIISTLMVEFGLRLTWSVGVVAAISFVGQGLQPPTADWGLMINQNRLGLAIQPLGVIGPILGIAAFTVGANLMTEGIARAVAGVEPRRKRRAK